MRCHDSAAGLQTTVGDSLESEVRDIVRRGLLGVPDVPMYVVIRLEGVDTVDWFSRSGSVGVRGDGGHHEVVRR
jgi:hypothetical protein